MVMGWPVGMWDDMGMNRGYFDVVFQMVLCRVVYVFKMNLL